MSTFDGKFIERYDKDSDYKDTSRIHTWNRCWIS